MTGIIVERSRFECVFATAIATSLPITVTPTCMTASGITGLTFPGMIDEPGWTAGRFSSRRPGCGPEPSHRRSLAILIMEIATVRMAPLRASRLHERIELLRLLRKAVLEFAERRQHAVIDLQQRGDMDGGGDDVVRRLAHVHVVVRVDQSLLAERMAEDLVRAVRDHLVRVHVGRGPAAGLKDVEGELCVQFPVHDLLARLDRSLADLGVEEAELHVRLGARHLDQAERVDEPPTEPDPADREVLDRTLGLDAPVRVLRDFDLPQEVFLDAEVYHSNAPAWPTEPAGH